ncbi:MAG TPA: hypothetical protein VFD38_18360, partial [Myxococcaceae bacterium]|nr:hypothetical protein [Myxococcaceae bacterium]
MGVVLGVVTYGVTRAFPASWQLGIEGALVRGCGVIHVGLRLASGTRPALVEATGGVVMLLLAVFGATSAPWLLTAALVLHAGWDLTHHEGRISRAVPRGYPSFCAAARP